MLTPGREVQSRLLTSRTCNRHIAGAINVRGVAGCNLLSPRTSTSYDDYLICRRHMRVDERLLGKRLKLKKFDKKLGVSRNEQMALSLPSTRSAPVYINACLGRFLKQHKVKRLYIYTDAAEEALAIEPTHEAEGFTLVPSGSGSKGWRLNAHLREVMPYGRYIFVEEDSGEGRMVFRREYSYVKGGINGKSENSSDGVASL